MGSIKRQVMATSLSDARDAARAYSVGGTMFGEKITKVTVKLATTGRRPYDIIIITSKRKGK